MAPTRSSVLAALALLIGVLSWIVVSQKYGSLPSLPAVGAVSLVILAIAELLLGVSVRRRLHNPSTPVQRRLEPIFVARLAVLGKASSHAAAIVAGGYGGFFVYTVTHLGKPKINTDSWSSGLSLVAAVALIGTALFLEYSCRVPRPPRENGHYP